MKKHPRKGDKREMEGKMHLTRPPRLEGKVKEAMMQPKKKPKKERPRRMALKSRGMSAQQRKDYQLPSKRHSL